MPTKQHSLFYITLIELVLIVSAVSVFHVFLMAIFSYQAAQPWPDEGPVSIAELLKRTSPPSAYLQFHIMLGCLWIIYFWNLLTAIIERTHRQAKLVILYSLVGIYLCERTLKFFQLLPVEI